MKTRVFYLRHRLTTRQALVTVVDVIQAVNDCQSIVDMNVSVDLKTKVKDAMAFVGVESPSVLLQLPVQNSVEYTVTP